MYAKSSLSREARMANIALTCKSELAHFVHSEAAQSVTNAFIRLKALLE